MSAWGEFAIQDAQRAYVASHFRNVDDETLRAAFQTRRRFYAATRTATARGALLGLAYEGRRRGLSLPDPFEPLN